MTPERRDERDERTTSTAGGARPATPAVERAAVSPGGRRARPADAPQPGPKKTKD